MAIAAVALHLTEAESIDQWSYAMFNFTPDDVIVIGSEDTNLPGRVLSNAEHVADVPSISTDLVRVLMQPLTGRNIQGETSLADFTHPVDALYIFGPDSAHLPADLDVDHKVYIPTDSDDGMWSWMAYSVTMWDRRNG